VAVISCTHPLLPVRIHHLDPARRSVGRTFPIEHRADGERGH
jgi:hypothetical protein